MFAITSFNKCKEELILARYTVYSNRNPISYGAYFKNKALTVLFHVVLGLHIPVVDLGEWSFLTITSTAKIAQVATSYNNPISGCVLMAWDSLWQPVYWKLSTGLVQVVNRLVTSWSIQQACYNLFQQVVASLQMTSCKKPDLKTCCNLMKLTSLLQLVDKLQQAGEIDNLQQVWRFGCVFAVHRLWKQSISKETNSDNNLKFA